MTGGSSVTRRRSITFERAALARVPIPWLSCCGGKMTNSSLTSPRKKNFSLADIPTNARMSEVPHILRNSRALARGEPRAGGPPLPLFPVFDGASRRGCPILAVFARVGFLTFR